MWCALLQLTTLKFRPSALFFPSTLPSPTPPSAPAPRCAPPCCAPPLRGPARCPAGRPRPAGRPGGEACRCLVSLDGTGAGGKKKKKGLTEEGRPWQPSRCGRSLAGVVFARPGAYVLRPLARPVLTRPPQPRSSASLSEGVAEVAGRQGRGGNGGGAPGRAEVRRRRQRGGPCPHPQQKREPEPPRSASIHTRAVCTPASPPGHGAQY